MQNMPDRNELIAYIQHDESAALYGEGILTDLTQGQYLLRVEACEATRPGNWFHGPFNDYSQAMSYAKYVANLGRSGIRRANALPLVWVGGSQGNPIQVIRLYRVIHPCPAISSVVAPQREGGSICGNNEEAQSPTRRACPRGRVDGDQALGGGRLPTCGTLTLTDRR